MKQSPETAIYAQMGMAALLPGMQFMLEKMQKELDEMRAHLAMVQNGSAREAVEEQRTGPKLVAAGRHGWGGMTAEERSAEMRRRQKVGRRKNVAASRWSKMTKKDKAEWLRKMQTGRKRAARAAKQLPVARLSAEVAA